MIPEFSIIIPTFNNLEYLKRALISIENQTEKNFETIVVVDGSTDCTIEYLNEYEKHKINLKFFYINASGGPAKPRNIGIQVSSGKWLCFLDSDDYWLSNKLKVIKNFIDKEKYDLFYHREFCNNRIINKRTYRSDLYNKLIVKGNLCSTSATVVNREFIIKKKILFNEDRRYISVEDYDFWLMIALKGGTFKHINKVLGYYRIHNNNLTKDILNHNKNYLRLIYKHVFYYLDVSLNKKIIFRKLLIVNKIRLFILKNNNSNFFFILFYKVIINILKNLLYLKIYLRKN